MLYSLPELVLFLLYGRLLVGNTLQVELEAHTLYLLQQFLLFRLTMEQQVVHYVQDHGVLRRVGADVQVVVQ